MSNHHEAKQDGELYISHVLAKKRFKVSRKQLNGWVREGKVRLLNQEVVRMPHQLINDPQLELHFFHAGDIEKAIQPEEGSKA